MSLIPSTPKQTIVLPHTQISTSFTTAAVSVPVNASHFQIEIDATAWPADSVMTLDIQTSSDGLQPFNTVAGFTFPSGQVSSGGIVFSPPTSAGFKARAVIGLIGSPIQLVGSVKLY